MEIYKKINGYEDLYEVSNYGNVKSKLRYKRNHDVILKPAIRGEYRFVILSKDGSTKSYSIHRLVAEMFVSNPLNKPEVNHIDGDKLNNNDWNLEWCTSSENQQHAYDNGLQPIPKTLKIMREKKRSDSNNWFEIQLGSRFIRFEYEPLIGQKAKTKKLMVIKCKECSDEIKLIAIRRTIQRTGGMCQECAYKLAGDKQKNTKMKI